MLQYLGALEIALIPLGLVLGTVYLIIAGAYFAFTIRVLTELWNQRKAWSPGKFVQLLGLTILTLGIYAIVPLVVLAL